MSKSSPENSPTLLEAVSQEELSNPQNYKFMANGFIRPKNAPVGGVEIAYVTRKTIKIPSNYGFKIAYTPDSGGYSAGKMALGEYKLTLACDGDFRTSVAQAFGTLEQKYRREALRRNDMKAQIFGDSKEKKTPVQKTFVRDPKATPIQLDFKLQVKNIPGHFKSKAEIVKQELDENGNPILVDIEDFFAEVKQNMPVMFWFTFVWMFKKRDDGHGVQLGMAAELEKLVLLGDAPSKRGPSLLSMSSEEISKMLEPSDEAVASASKPSKPKKSKVTCPGCSPIFQPNQEAHTGWDGCMGPSFDDSQETLEEEKISDEEVEELEETLIEEGRAASMESQTPKRPSKTKARQTPDAPKKKKAKVETESSDDES